MGEYVGTRQPRQQRGHLSATGGAQSHHQLILRRLAREDWAAQVDHIDARTAGLMLALGPQPREGGVLSKSAWQQGMLLDTAAQWGDLNTFRTAACDYAEELGRQAARRDADKTLLERLSRWTRSRDTHAHRALRKREVAQKSADARSLLAAVGRTHVCTDTELAYLKAKPVADIARAAVNTGAAAPDLSRFTPEAVTTAHRLLKAAPTAGAVWRDPFHLRDGIARGQKVVAVTNSVGAWLAKAAADEAHAAEHERQAVSRAVTLSFKAGLWGADEEQLTAILNSPARTHDEPRVEERDALVAEHLTILRAARAGGAVAYLSGIREEEARIEQTKHTGLNKWLRQGCVYGRKGTRRVEAAYDLVTRRAEDIEVMKVLLAYGLHPATSRADTAVPAVLGLTTAQRAKLRGLLEPKLSLARPGPGREGLTRMICRIDEVPDAWSMLKAVRDHGTDHLKARRAAAADTLEALRRGIEKLQRSGKEQRDEKYRKAITDGKALVAEAVSVLAALDRQIELQHSPTYAALVRVMAWPGPPGARHLRPA
ncbi:hypothetical protein AB8O64_35985 (plasmid) [Streptomyces sp. QH1-20]|uniref:hypothetical protein n=1 Tax=Streptomyces sp. QH1-20 TaxID=3240934 RepID=UPI0035196802